MMIDTDKITDWAKTHLTLVIPAATGALSWFSAMRWQAAIDHNQIALTMFYFCICAVSGITTAVLVLGYLNRIGCFGDSNCRCR